VMDRQEVKQITKQWVRDNCKYITERDMKLLELLYVRRFLRRDQIEGLMPGVFASTDKLNRRLKKLYELHVIDRIRPKVGMGMGSSKHYVCLDRAGFLLLDVKPYKYIQERDGIKFLNQKWEHLAMIHDYEIMVRELAKEMGMVGLCYWVEEPIYYDNTSVIPDLLCVIQKDNEYPISFFIEVDLDTENIPALKGKVENYRNCYMSKTWTKEEWALDIRRAFPNKPVQFPRILLFTNDGLTRRVNTMREYVKDTGSLKFHVDYHSNARKIIEKIIKR
jgi:hypothetical protein